MIITKIIHILKNSLKYQFEVKLLTKEINDFIYYWLIIYIKPYGEFKYINNNNTIYINNIEIIFYYL